MALLYKIYFCWSLKSMVIITTENTPNLAKPERGDGADLECIGWGESGLNPN